MESFTTINDHVLQKATGGLEPGEAEYKTTAPMTSAATGQAEPTDWTCTNPGKDSKFMNCFATGASRDGVSATQIPKTWLNPA